jgi:ATP synthase I chain
MTTSTDNENPFLNFTDADLTAALLRAVRSIAMLALIGALVIWIISGWQTAALFVIGALLSAAGVYESRRLIAIVNAKLDRQKTSGSSGLVVTMFLLRLAIAAAVLYASLKCLHGSVYGMIAGLSLAIVALSLEVIKLTR